MSRHKHEPGFPDWLKVAVTLTVAVAAVAGRATKRAGPPHVRLPHVSSYKP